MKKLLAIVIAFITCLSLVACGKTTTAKKVDLSTLDTKDLFENTYVEYSDQKDDTVDFNMLFSKDVDAATSLFNALDANSTTKTYAGVYAVLIAKYDMTITSAEVDVVASDIAKTCSFVYTKYNGEGKSATKNVDLIGGQSYHVTCTSTLSFKKGDKLILELCCLTKDSIAPSVMYNLKFNFE